jgi:hypothetical protein
MGSATDYLTFCVYFDGALGNRYTLLPGTRLVSALESLALGPEKIRRMTSKIEQSCRKTALMWRAGDLAQTAEREFYCTTLSDAPALFGEDAVNVHYHLEAFVLLARSALDIGAGVFGELLPDPFPRKRYDSFNDLLKAIVKSANPPALAAGVQSWRDDKHSWLSIIADIEKGRSLRDKLAHQMGFPLAYAELNPISERESAVVIVSDNYQPPLPEFIERLRTGVVSCYLDFEAACLPSGT